MTGDNSMDQNGLITLVFSYLQTWHQTKSRAKHKELIFNKHIQTIHEYITGKDCQRKVLTAMEFFFHKLKQQGPEESNDNQEIVSDHCNDI